VAEMKKHLICILILKFWILNIQNVWAAKLAIVMDDFGYRQRYEEQIIALSSHITIAVLPYSPNAKRIATMAHQHGNDVIIHLPMAPLGKQPLEKYTLFPHMTEAEISRIIDNAVERVPYAIGVNNHMGSLMTSNQKGMEYVMKALSQYSMFFLDSKTIGKTQVKAAAHNYNIPVVVRDVFLDDDQSEKAIRYQVDLAISLARKNGYAIAIGHPYPQTINALKFKLANLPADIELVSISHLATPLTKRSKIILKDIFEKYKKQFSKIYYLFSNVR
jgi:uncharacterized protein